jgi:D-aminopeptidase
VGQELGRYYLKDDLDHATGDPSTNQRLIPTPLDPSNGSLLSALPVLRDDTAGGSVIIVVATDAPVDHRNLQRMAARTMLGLARTGSSGSNESGDYAIAFSTAPNLRIVSGPRLHPSVPQSYPYLPIERTLLTNDAMSPLFLAVIEATEEAVDNSLFRATTMTGQGRTVEALPIEQTVHILRQHGLLKTE